jgi:hypothetical protein
MFLHVSRKVPIHAMKKGGGTEGVSPLIQNLGTVQCEWLASRCARFTLGQIASDTH